MVPLRKKTAPNVRGYRCLLNVRRLRRACARNPIGVGVAIGIGIDPDTDSDPDPDITKLCYANMAHINTKSEMRPSPLPEQPTSLVLQPPAYLIYFPSGFA